MVDLVIVTLKCIFIKYLWIDQKLKYSSQGLEF